MVTALIGSGIALALCLHTIVNSLLLRSPSRSRVITEKVAILVPCRNEQENVVDLLTSLQHQQDLNEWQILLLDDSSTDLTLQRAMAASDARTTIISGLPLADRWLGKPFACHQLAESVEADVLVFIDADVRLEPTAVSQAVATMRDLSLDLISPYPSQIARSWSERLVQPLLHWSWLATLPLRAAEKSAGTSLTAANGQFLVVDANAYRASGGHHEIRDRVLDDMELLKSLKKKGFRGVVIDGSELASCRMYSNWRELEEGYTKWLWAAFGSPVVSIGTVLFLLLAFIAPLGQPIGALGYFAGVVSRLVSAVRTKGRLVDSFFHPLSIALLIYLMARSWQRKISGSTTWKGRTLTS